MTGGLVPGRPGKSRAANSRPFFTLIGGAAGFKKILMQHNNAGKTFPHQINHPAVHINNYKRAHTPCQILCQRPLTRANFHNDISSCWCNAGNNLPANILIVQEMLPEGFPGTEVFAVHWR